MSSQVLQPREPFSVVPSQWSDIHRQHYGYADESFPHSSGGSDSAVPARSTSLFQPDEAAFISSFLDNPPSAFDNSGFDLGNDVGGNFDWLLNEAPPSLREVSTGPPTSRPQFSHSFGEHGLHLQTNFPNTPSEIQSAPVGGDGPVRSMSGPMSALAPPTQRAKSSLQVQQRPPVPTLQRAKSQSVAMSGSGATPYFPTAETTANALRETLKDHRRKSSTGAQANTRPALMFNLVPYEEAGEPSPVAKGTFDENSHAPAAHAPQRLSSQQPQEQQPQPKPTHARTQSDPPAPQLLKPDAAEEASDPRRLYRFGSDQHFSEAGFVRGNGEPTVRELTQRMLDENFGAIGGGPISADVSRIPSPVGNGPAGLSSLRRKRGSEGEDTEDAVDDESDESPYKRKRLEDMTPTERRVSTVKEWERRASATAAAHAAAVAAMSPPNGTKRRRSSPPADVSAAAAAAAANSKKPPRENLTEEQKRNNHIVSEQKRRNLIKNGFEELNMLVPALREGGFSKSNVLIETAAYLELLVQGNAELGARLGGYGLH